MNTQITETSSLTLHTINFDVVLCAWCLSEQGVAAGNGSHGICMRHKDAMLRAHRELRVTMQSRKING